MITPQELHIEINQQFQKVASNIYDYFLPEEVDWILNKISQRFIGTCITPKGDGSGAFEINESALDDIQNLIESNIALTVFYDISNNSFSRGYGLLPSDYGYLINDRSVIVSDCSSNFTINTTNKDEYVGLLEFSNSGNSSSPYYKAFNIIINGRTIFDITNYNLSSGLSDVNEKFVIIHLVLSELREKGIEIFWERYRDLYEPDNFILVYDNDPISGSITIDGVSNLMSITKSTYQIFMTGNESEVPNRLINSAALYRVLNNNVYYKSIPRSPISSLANNKLYIFYSKRFIVNTLNIDYIRKPRKISLSLNQSSELSDNALRKVCDLSVEYMKNLIESPAYQMKVNDNILRME